MKKPMKLLAVALFGLAGPFLQACATVVEGSTQPLTLSTDPSGAQCEISRNGALVGAVSSTPGTIQISKSNDDLEITCKRSGHLDTRQTVASGTTGWVAGNILFGLLGGPIGLFVDTASGSLNEYPETVQFALYPGSFPTAEARERFFATRIDEINAKFRMAEEHLQQTCSQNRPTHQSNRENCERGKEALRAARDESLAELERQKETAVIEDRIAGEM